MDVGKWKTGRDHIEGRDGDPIHDEFGNGKTAGAYFVIGEKTATFAGVICNIVKREWSVGAQSQSVYYQCRQDRRGEYVYLPYFVFKRNCSEFSAVTDSYRWALTKVR